MTTTSSYMPDLSRVRVEFSGFNPDADVARVERSINGITWTTVRGGEAVTLTAGGGRLDDYEFVPGVLNTYRVTAIDTSVIQATLAGTYTTANNASVVPPLPAGILAGNMMVLTATHQNTAATVNTPAGWTLLAGGAGHFTTFYREYQVGVTAPTVTFSGGSAGQSCSATIRGFTNAGAPVHLSMLTNAAAQNVAYPGTFQPHDGIVYLLHEWKQSTGSGVSLPLEFNGDPWGGFNTAGASAESQIIWRTVGDAWHTITAGTSVWSGGSAAVSKARLMYMVPREFTNQETTTITPTIDKVWIKNPARPYMNTALETPVGLLTPERKARAGVFAVVGRTLPVAVTDFRLGKEYTIGAQVESDVERDRLDAILTAGDVVFVQIPPGTIRLKSIFAVIGDSTYDDESSIQWLPLTQVAAPSGSIYGTTSTCQTVISTYATCADLIAAKATCADVLDIVGDPSDIITG
jgi:hypothetical protein